MSENEKLNNTEKQLKEIKMLKKSLQKKRKRAFWKSCLTTSLIIIGAIIGVMIGSVAWFIMNDQVHAENAVISASGSYTFSLATLQSDEQGVYKQGIYDVNESKNQSGESVEESLLAKALNKFFRPDKNGRDDEYGNHYTSFWDLPNLSVGTSVFTDQSGKKYIRGDSDGISLMVNETSNVNNTTEFDYIGPGSYGEFTFYIIPHIENFNQVNVSVSLKPFTLERVEEGTGTTENKKVMGRAKIVENNDANNVLLNMLQGHILLFTGKDGEGNYSNRILPNLENDGTISFKFTKDSNTSTWVKDQPEPVTIYWIWPKRFENIKYCGQEDSVFKSTCQEHTELLNWINESQNREYVVNTNTITNTAKLEDVMKDMTNQQFAQWSTGYNKGDQLIGDNIAFFQWVIDAE